MKKYQGQVILLILAESLAIDYACKNICNKHAYQSPIQKSK